MFRATLDAHRASTAREGVWLLVLQDWEFRPRVSFVREMQKGVVSVRTNHRTLSRLLDLRLDRRESGRRRCQGSRRPGSIP